MFDSAIFDVVIGVTFIYLFLSLIATAAMEALSQLFNMRAKNLEEGIRSILNDPAGDGLTGKFYQHPLIRGITTERQRLPNALAQKMKTATDRWPALEKIVKKTRNPSYISPRTFALAFMDVAIPTDPQKGVATIDDVRQGIAKIENEDLRQIVLAHLNSAENDLQTMRKNIEKWFDDSMARISGWYKRKSQLLLYVIAAVIAVGFNADTFTIANALYRDPAMRAGVAAMAGEAVKQPLPSGKEETAKKIEEMNAGLEKLNLPLGWQAFSQSKARKPAEVQQAGYRARMKTFIKQIRRELPPDTAGRTARLAGWLVTMFAVSLGAPFWFDTLSKFINIRAAGKKPGKQ